MDIVKIIETLPKYAQVLYNDCAMHLLKDQNITQPLRKQLILDSIKFIREQLDAVENHVNSDNQSVSTAV